MSGIESRRASLGNGQSAHTGAVRSFSRCKQPLRPALLKRVHHQRRANADWNVEAIVDAFAAAAANPSSWPDAMEIASHQLGGCGAVLLPVHGRMPLIPHSESMVPSFEAYVRDGWANRDRRYE